MKGIQNKEKTSYNQNYMPQTGISNRSDDKKLFDSKLPEGSGVISKHT